MRSAVAGSILALAVLAGHGVAAAAGAASTGFREEFRVKRKPVFEFASKPVVTRRGDRVTVRFACRDYCDVTVAVEDAGGRIIRHLASGVLGENAPAPFSRKSLRQEVVWDGKDDRGRYVDDKESCSLRVSLGLKARFERALLWSPHRRICNQGHAPTLNAPAPFVARPEGVYVFDGSMHDHLRLFDHRGNYLRTVYPFPRDRLGDLRGVKTHKMPQSGRRLPLKGGNYQSTLLTSGTSSSGPYLNQLFGLAATAMAVRGKRVALFCGGLNRLGTDGSTGGLPLGGARTSFTRMLPRSAALSPDGRTLYVTGFNQAVGRPNWRLNWLQGVASVDFEKGGKVQTFAGVLAVGRKHGGSADGRFKTPVSVATDPQGRVYVADRFNSRIQVFAADGKHLKNIKVPGGDASLPSEVVVNQRNGDVYVFSWYMDGSAFRKKGMRKRVARLFHFGPFDRPKLKGTYGLPIRDQSRRGLYGGDELQGREFRATVDPWAPDELPYVWLVPGAASGRRGSIAQISPRVLRIDRGKKQLVEVANFNSRLRMLLPDNLYWGNGNRRLAVRPTTGELYVQRENIAVVVDPDSGKARVIKLPVEPMGGGLYFDVEGHAYLRATRFIARFAISAGGRWREVPFDYGEKRSGRISVVPIGTPSIHGQPAFSVSIDQHLVVGYIVGKVVTHDRTRDRQRQQAARQWKSWTPTVFPGRGGNTVVSVWDRYGRVVHKDAVRGVGYLAGVFMDRRGDLYLASEAQRGGYFDKMTGTFVKFKANGRILSTEAAVPLRGKRDSAPDTHCGAGHKGSSWWEGAEWFYGGMGYCGKNNSTCHCPKFQAAHDYFARSFVPETQHYSVAVLDPAGNLVMRVGGYGNVDDGVPLTRSAKVKHWKPRSIGGDEVGLFYPAYLATHTDRRLYINDPGNARILSVKLGYHTEHRTALKSVREVKD